MQIVQSLDSMCLNGVYVDCILFRFGEFEMKIVPYRVKKKED